MITTEAACSLSRLGLSFTWLLLSANLRKPFAYHYYLSILSNLQPLFLSLFEHLPSFMICAKLAHHHQQHNKAIEILDLHS